MSWILLSLGLIINDEQLTLCIVVSVHVLEQSGRREISDLKQQLQSSQDLVAELKKTLQHRDAELETLRSTVSPFMDDATSNHNHNILA